MPELKEAGRPTVLLLFGVPESGVEAAARAINAAGAALAADAETGEGRFAVSAGLDRLALEINAPFGSAEDLFSPIALPNASLAVSRRRIAAEFEPRRAEAAEAFARALPESDAPPVVIAAAAMSAFPGFWLDAATQAGARPRAVLVHRNPLAIAQLARAAGGRPPRQTIFEWHHLALEVLSADPAAVAVLDSPAFDLGSLGDGLVGPAAESAPVRHAKDDADLSHSSLVSDQSRDLHRLLGDWRTLGGKARANALARLRRRFDEAVTLTAAARIVTRATRAAPRSEPPLAVPAVQAPPAPAPARSPLLFHYHIFKNAGTSVDRMLKANFGDRWTDGEFSETPLARRHQSIREFLAARPEVQAFSSHTAPLPTPDLPDREVFPIVFVRHPLLRVRSAYRFERRQDATTRGAILAKSTDFRGYVAHFLDDPKARHLRNFQSIRFAEGTPGSHAQEPQRALETLARLPFVGLVEAYDESVARLGELVRAMFPDFRVIVLHENATAADAGASSADQLAALREELGADLYDRLAEANASDLELFERVRARYATAR